MMILQPILFLTHLATGSSFSAKPVLRSKTRLRALQATPPGILFDDDTEKSLWLMTSFFANMVDQSSNRFYYICHPKKCEKIHQHMPIRDLAAIWDATKALEFWRGANIIGIEQSEETSSICKILDNAIRQSLREYNSSYKSIVDGVIMDPEILKETPTIAHSAMMILASAGALRLSLFDDTSEIPPIKDLIRGILSSQLPNGAFVPEFLGSENDVYRGIEFTPGEAMVALMDVCKLSTTMDGVINNETRECIISSMRKAFRFYSNFYYEGDADINYNIWQIQAFARLFDHLISTQSCEIDELDSIRRYVLDLCDDIVNSKSWKYEVARGQSFYLNVQTVEIACGLDSLVDGLKVSRSGDDFDSRALRYEMNIKNAMYFLEWAQSQVPADSPAGYGGLGYGGVQVFEQRLDVTGHAISAFTKKLSDCS